MAKRRFIDAPDHLRCTATVTLCRKTNAGAKGSDDKARCGRYAKFGTLCAQHKRIADRESKKERLETFWFD